MHIEPTIFKGSKGEPIMTKKQVRSLIDRKFEKPEYHDSFERNYPAFVLEAQILRSLEEKEWTYDDLAKATRTQKSNISRDLKAGGIQAASFSRISKIAEALGKRLIALLVPMDQVRFLLPRIEEFLGEAVTTAGGEARIAAAPQPVGLPRQELATENVQINCNMPDMIQPSMVRP